MKDILSLVRPNILALDPYSTARDDYSGGSLGIFLDANESPYNNGFNRYPDPHQKLLKKKISQIKGVPVENIFIGNGSDEAIDILFRVFCVPGKDNAVAIAPSYGMYGVAAATNDIEMRQVRLNDDFSLDTEKLLAATDSNTKLIFLCSPNNPSGNSIPEAQIVDLLDRFNGIVALDEAYIDFSSQKSMLSRLGEFKNLVVMQTFSKAWGLAGLRLGLAFSAPEINAIFAKVKYPYNINILAQQTAWQRISEAEKDRHVAEIKEQRERVADELAKIPTVKKIWPSDANFLLVEFDDADKTYDLLVSNGIIVRNRNKVAGCKGCLRITIGRPSENDRLLELLSNPSEAKPATMVPESEGQRQVTISRKTRETDITLFLDLDNPGIEDISTGIGFFDHMLAQIPHHGGVSLKVDAKGDLEVDEHHTIEDVGIVLGEAIAKALGDKVGIERYGFVLPMDDCDAMVLLDFGGRIDFEWDAEFKREKIGEMPTEMFKHFFQSVCSGAKCNLHIKATGENEHHKAESIFKAFARALRMAVAHSVFPYELPSSKGAL